MSLLAYFLDDELEILEIFQDMYCDSNHVVKTFSDHEKFIEAIRGQRPDVVFIDFRLPRISGEQVAQMIDALPGARISKALVTGDLDVQSNPYFDAVFGKPMQFDQISAFLDRCRANKNSK